ncbi:hypothetical protein MMC12_004576 [Toensbergia leucococca]|nr:hypothetical protein [Toensbergia leucococca]
MFKLKGSHQSTVETASIAPSQADTLVDDDATQRFTATGRPQPPYKASGLANLASGTGAACEPQFLPHQFNDESIIPVSVRLRTDEAQPEQKKSNGVLGKMRKFSSSKETPKFRTLKMPRGEYLRYFARDEKNAYIGTEPERSWTDKDLEEKFGMYQNLPPTQWKVNVPSGLK